MIVRSAREGDVPAILTLLNPIIRDTTVTFTTQVKTAQDIHDTIAEHEAHDWPFLVAEDTALRGVAHYFPFRKGPGYAQTMEHTIYIDPMVNGNGIGRQLMHKLEGQARARGVSNFIGGISGENLNGLAFHKALGFSDVGRLIGVGHKFGRSLDLVLMQKSLVTAPENLA
jgi:phosphinothricin acetyltransferase